MRACMPRGWEHMRGEVIEDWQKEERKRVFVYYVVLMALCVFTGHML